MNYFDQEVVMDYHQAIADRNAFVMTQWSANGIDVRTPEDDDTETELAVQEYANKMARIQSLEEKLHNAFVLKIEGKTNEDIRKMQSVGMDKDLYKVALRRKSAMAMFNPVKKLYYGQTSSLIYEVQEQLNRLGYEIKTDGIYKEETFNAIKNFEEVNKLYVDGYLDQTTMSILFE